MLISVIIPTRNRASVLVDAVRSILDGNFAQCEIIIVDQSTDDSTQKALEASVADHCVFYVRNERRGASSSRNLGIAHSLGDIVVFTDDDVTTPPDWLTRIAAEFDQNPTLDFLCGSLIAPPYDPQAGFTPEYRADPTISRWHLPLLVSNANMSFRRQLFDRIGTYDELCGPGSVLRSSDDGDIALRVIRKGGHWKLNPAIEVIHTHGFRPKVEGTALLAEYEYGNGGIVIGNRFSGSWRVGCQGLYCMG